jgi:ribosomal protein L21
MTVKEIASAVNKDSSTVSRWVERVSCKMQEVYCKMQEAKATKKPADYTLAETCAIIAEGMGEDVANVFRTNATQSRAKEMQLIKIPSGAALKELRIAAQSGLLTKEQFQVMIGAPIMAGKPTQLQALIQRLSKQAYAVEMANRAKAEAKAKTEAKTPLLF